MEDIQPDIPIDVPNTQDVDNLTQEMSRTSISRQKISFMGPLRPKYKQKPAASDKKSKLSRRVRRLILLRIIDGHPYATISDNSQNLEALNLE